MKLDVEKKGPSEVLSLTFDNGFLGTLARCIQITRKDSAPEGMLRIEELLPEYSDELSQALYIHVKDYKVPVCWERASLALTSQSSFTESLKKCETYSISQIFEYDARLEDSIQGRMIIADKMEMAEKGLLFTRQLHSLAMLMNYNQQFVVNEFKCNSKDEVYAAISMRNLEIGAAQKGDNHFDDMTGRIVSQLLSNVSGGSNPRAKVLCFMTDLTHLALGNNVQKNSFGSNVNTQPIKYEGTMNLGNKFEIISFPRPPQSPSCKFEAWELFSEKNLIVGTHADYNFSEVFSKVSPEEIKQRGFNLEVYDLSYDNFVKIPISVLLKDSFRFKENGELGGDYFKNFLSGYNDNILEKRGGSDPFTYKDGEKYKACKKHVHLRDLDGEFCGHFVNCFKSNYLERQLGRKNLETFEEVLNGIKIGVDGLGDNTVYRDVVGLLTDYGDNSIVATDLSGSTLQSSINASQVKNTFTLFDGFPHFDLYAMNSRAGKEILEEGYDAVSAIFKKVATILSLESKSSLKRKLILWAAMQIILFDCERVDDLQNISTRYGYSSNATPGVTPYTGVIDGKYVEEEKTAKENNGGHTYDSIDGMLYEVMKGMLHDDRYANLNMSTASFLDKFLILVFFSSEINRNTWIKLMNEGIPIPVSISFRRSNQCWESQRVLYGVSGGSIGVCYSAFPSVMDSPEAPTHKRVKSLMLTIGPAIVDDKAFYAKNDVALQKYGGGLDTTTMKTPEHFEPSEGKLGDGSAFVFLGGLNSYGRPTQQKHRTLSGRMRINPIYYEGGDIIDSDDCTNFYNSVWRFNEFEGDEAQIFDNNLKTKMFNNLTSMENYYMSGHPQPGTFTPYSSSAFGGFHPGMALKFTGKGTQSGSNTFIANSSFFK